ncbi:hypothetical protein FB45DRAFT_1063263 [Roridomyces roridus]|uniref:Uncharacterized protein n=1 Tax=Roridomyces roridus TaxID=1738132 RepID=A0AAD7BEW6_9AGAR|nr:hypothetical protein FB45DRAFT_1063263 [Roridomyces roridus]
MARDALAIGEQPPVLTQGTNASRNSKRSRPPSDDPEPRKKPRVRLIVRPPADMVIPAPPETPVTKSPRRSSKSKKLLQQQAVVIAHLDSQLDKLSSSLDCASTSSSIQTAQLAVAWTTISQLQSQVSQYGQEIERLREENDRLGVELQRANTELSGSPPTGLELVQRSNPIAQSHMALDPGLMGFMREVFAHVKTCNDQRHEAQSVAMEAKAQLAAAQQRSEIGNYQRLLADRPDPAIGDRIKALEDGIAALKATATQNAPTMETTTQGGEGRSRSGEQPQLLSLNWAVIPPAPPQSSLSPTAPSTAITTSANASGPSPAPPPSQGPDWLNITPSHSPASAASATANSVDRGFKSGELRLPVGGLGSGRGGAKTSSSAGPRNANSSAAPKAGTPVVGGTKPKPTQKPVGQVGSTTSNSGVTSRRAIPSTTAVSPRAGQLNSTSTRPTPTPTPTPIPGWIARQDAAAKLRTALKRP